MDRYKLFLLIILIAVFIWSGTNPLSSSNWFLENTPIMIAGFLFIWFEIHTKMSKLSSTLITLYLVLPLIGSHYGISNVPLGSYIGRLLGTTRNMYDRLTHFSFGFLGFYPIYEYIKYLLKKEGGWNYYITATTILAFSGVYEIFEWMAAIWVNPALATSFLGAQGDFFDTQKDMVTSAVGMLCAMLIIFLFQKYKNREA